MGPRLFIGCSKEQLSWAYALQEGLHHDVEATVWTQGIMELSDLILNNLLKQLANSDYGAFILAPDDVLRIRKSTVEVARDNVIFELWQVPRISDTLRLGFLTLRMNLSPFKMKTLRRHFKSRVNSFRIVVEDMLTDSFDQSIECFKSRSFSKFQFK